MLRMRGEFGEDPAPGGSSDLPRVRFHSDTAVFEFDRQLFGGGGIPGSTPLPVLHISAGCSIHTGQTQVGHPFTDADSVSLGLGPRLVNSYTLPLSEKQDKDDYACNGANLGACGQG